MQCRESLLRSIRSIHCSVLNYAHCINQANDGKKEHLFAVGLELSHQLLIIRNMYIEQYGVDPITGHICNSICTNYDEQKQK